MGVGQSNDLNTHHGPSFRLAHLLPLTPNPSYTNFSSSRATNIPPIPTNATPTCISPGITLHLPRPNHHLGGVRNIGTGKEVLEDETLGGQIMLDGGGSSSYAYNYSIATTTSSTTPTPTSRWNPTPEQLLALEEIYSRGMRTPSAEQIQQIASELRRFGKIEGKNVFYWFQNHKARERQKRRREGENNSKLQKQEVGIPDKIEPGIRSSAHDQLQHSKNLVASSHCKRNIEGLVPMQRASAQGERRTHGWPSHQFQELRGSPSQLNNDTSPNDYISPPIFHKSFPSTPKFLVLEEEGTNLSNNTLEDEARQVQTLQLFPLRGAGDNGDYEGMVKSHTKDKEVAVTAINTKTSPGDFFEFLPLKN